MHLLRLQSYHSEILNGEGNTVSLIMHDTEGEDLDDVYIVYMSGTAMEDMMTLYMALSWE